MAFSSAVDGGAPKTVPAVNTNKTKEVIQRIRLQLSENEPLKSWCFPQCRNLARQQSVQERVSLLHRRSFLALGFLALTGPSRAAGPDLILRCQSAGRALLVDKTGGSAVLKERSLTSWAITYVGPKFPGLARQMRFEGDVPVGVLVDGRGGVTCASIVNGHPLMIGSAIDAALHWKFRLATQKGRRVLSYGILVFHFSTGNGAGKSCLDAHW
jgi:hypothetical protein